MYNNIYKIKRIDIKFILPVDGAGGYILNVSCINALNFGIFVIPLFLNSIFSNLPSNADTISSWSCCWIFGYFAANNNDQVNEAYVVSVA